MKSAFFILIFLVSSSLYSDVATIATPNGRVKSINLIDNLGYDYSDWEYTTSVALNNSTIDSNKITLSDDHSLELLVGDDELVVNAFGQSISYNMGMPALYFKNRIIVPFKDYIFSLDSLGLCKVIAIENNTFTIEETDYLKDVPFIEQYSHKFNMVYYKKVYNKVMSKYKKTYYRPAPKRDKSIEMLRGAMSEKNEPGSENMPKKDTYYDIPRDLNREEVLKKKKN